MIHKSIIYTALLAAALPLSAALLDQNGRPYSEIVVADNAPSTVTLAATELRDFLAKRCNAELKITSTPTTSPVIFVGASKELSKCGLDASSFPSEGYAIKTGDGFLALYGRDYDGPPILGEINPFRPVEAYNPELKLCAFGEAGTLNAVYEFLQQTCGIRFYMPGDIGTIIPKSASMTVPSIDVKTAPRTSYRYPWFSMHEYSKENALWSRRIGFGGKAPAIISHTYRRMQRFKESHPEYYALVDGNKRAFTNECVADGEGHLCLTNKDLIRQWSEDIIDFFKKNPQYDVYPMAPEDGLTRICSCPECAAELRPDMPENGKFSYHIWNFTRKVAAEVGKVFPDKYVGCLAYEKYRMPPKEIDRMPNVAVMFCNNRSSLANPETMKSLNDEISSWYEKVDRVYLWNWYLTQWLPWTGLPVVYDDTIERELKWLFSNPKYSGEFIEAESEGGKGEGLHRFTNMVTPALQHWSLYITARLHQHPDLDVRKEYEEFCHLFYGKASDPMKRFWNKCRDVRNDAFAKNASPSPDAIYTTAIISELKELLAEAIKAAAGDSTVLARIKMLSDEFEKGASRIIRLESTSSRTLSLTQLEDGFKSLEKVIPENFLSKNGESVTPQTWLYAGFDRQFIYFRFICYEPQMDALVAKVAKPNEGEIWMDDSIEIFLCPNETKREDCYQLLINTNTVVDDGHYLPVEKRRDTNWQSKAEARIVKEANRWNLYVKMPFASIGISDPFFTGSIAAEFYRNRLGITPLKSTCWSPTGNYGHFVPNQFGILKFTK